MICLNTSELLSSRHSYWKELTMTKTNNQEKTHLIQIIEINIPTLNSLSIIAYGPEKHYHFREVKLQLAR